VWSHLPARTTHDGGRQIGLKRSDISSIDAAHSTVPVPSRKKVQAKAKVKIKIKIKRV
jgi:hypothetical protein